MFKYLTLDIETIPTERNDVREFIAKGITHPGNISKAETIAKWNEESRPAAIDEAVAKTGLDGAFGRVCCIGYAIDESGAPESIHGDGVEANILTMFNNRLNELIHSSMWSATTIVGHNVSSFDLRFLLQRYIVNGVRPHPIISTASRAKPWENEKVFDTMVQFSGVGNRISLDKLCMALGVESKGDISGADVWPMYKAGKIAEIAEYCRHDVEITRQCFKRMTFAEAMDQPASKSQ